VARGRPRVLVVAAYYPDPPSWGAAARVYHLTRQLATWADVTFLGYSDVGDEPSGPLRDVCERVRVVEHHRRAGLARRAAQLVSVPARTPYHCRTVRSLSMQTALDELLDGDSFDVVQVEASPMMSFRLRTTAAVVLDEHNIESEVLRRQGDGERSPMRRWFNIWESRKYVRHEQWAWNQADACLVTSERERPRVAARAPRTAVAVVPNGVDPILFAPADGRTVRDPDGIVFTGLLSYRPNLDGVRWFVDEVLPSVRRERPGATLTVVGGGTAAELDAVRAPGVVVTGLVPDVRPYLWKAACVVAPIRVGGGTRLKVLEGLATARPMVSTALGCEGLNVHPGRELLVADDPSEFAAAVATVLGDERLAADLGRRGRACVVDHYSWDSIGERLREVYEDLVSIPCIRTSTA
jgi:glycosyltransferase involved in cell wall biosynthesis